jgi:hypothetical protein
MEHERFDRLSRLVGRRRSRRGTLAALVGGLAAAVVTRQTTSAQRGPGASCSHSGQCSDAYGSSFVCDDNQFDYDGALNCCTYEWGGCARNEECCGAFSCLDGVCRYFAPLAGAGKGCASDFDCSPGQTGLACDFNNWDNAGRVCCHYAGGSCQYDGHCCGSYACVGGVCS